MWSCTNQTSIEKPLRYSGFHIENPQYCYGEEINSSFGFTFPSEILLTDSLIIVMSPEGSSQILHLFEKSSGQHITSIGSKGRGPGEVIMPEAMCIDKNNLLSVYDGQFGKIVTYDLTKAIRKEPYVNEDINISKYTNSLNSQFYSETAQKLGSDFIVKGRSNTTRFLKINEHNATLLTETIPRIVEDSEENNAIWSFSSKWKIKPDSKKIVIGTYIGGVMQIADINSYGIRSDTLLAFEKPIYKIVDGAKPKWITHTKETVFGFEDISVTNDYIYAIKSNPYFNTEKGDKTYVYVIDWNGIKRGVLSFDNWIYCGVVDDTNSTFYALAEKEDNYVLMKYNIKENSNN